MVVVPDEVKKTHDAWKGWWAGIKDEKDIAKTKEKVAAVAKAVEAFHKAQGKYPEIAAFDVTDLHREVLVHVPGVTV